jgi:FHS family L-fucose permease-like MFS transporter
MSQSFPTSSDKHMRFAFAMVTSLFFLWGTAYGLLDVLNKHFQENLDITKSRSALLQTAYFGAYFLMALPAGMFMKRYGYKRGIILGLTLFASGAFLFYPATGAGSYSFFLGALFVLACGLACLETAANPYITVLGQPEKSSFRLNLAQSFNGVGSFIGPLLGGALFFTGSESENASSVQLVYIGLGAIVTLVALLFLRTPLPEIRNIQEKADGFDENTAGLWSVPHFRNAVFAQFFYVAAQVGIAAFFINYCEELGIGLTPEKAAYFLSVSMVVFTVGRFLGSALMTKVAPATLLTAYSLINMAMILVVVFHSSIVSVYLLIAIFFFESIMFPTIFALGVQGLGNSTHKASSYLIMAIVGGAVVPYFMGWISDQYSTSSSFLVPFFCFGIVAFYGWQQQKSPVV